ncbi:alpha-ketoglutarate-dependent dioxygenase AlkB [Aliiglaciecola sp. 3_MG-2023]|uniref:alpha-ketoglutarate-dependent dioxygenase AlkB family protein n=1 Tax=Aliiglaciecola sp. 3_MG-2023 TaxID=3062644 RepID=UPI0026E2B31D|nr:alpha-ketoglutarate-dependent dioxygenase AlkB [Aliiglaciecola sp. 3_MG-2023]MDO6692209.1 alpha-ketoglutarate-dependent dioxygenase AlkB [Aliiglaciecola sp. 3_MG-2023]
MQQDLFSSHQTGLSQMPMQDADVHYQADFLDSGTATELYQKLQSKLAWQQDSIQVYGRKVKIPRFQAWYGDKEANYQYSGLSMQPNPWIKELAQLKLTLEQVCKTKFNSVLANWYRNGQDSMGWHGDNEPELGYQPIIASLTLGQTRDFDFKHIHTGQKVRLPLQNGSLLMMAGNTQKFWQHSLPKRSQSLGGRINLTFRQIF